MAIFKDVVVNIRRLTSAIAVPNHGLCLILSTESINAYKEYSDIAAVAIDYPSSTSAYMMASAIFAQDPKTDKVAIVGIQFTENFSEVIDGLNLVQNSNGGFTFLVSDVLDLVNVAALAAWATANKVFYVATVPVASFQTFASPNSDYCVIMVHDGKVKDESQPNKILEFADAALVGKCSTYQPGSATWMFKSLNGITPVKFDDQAAMVELINEAHYMTYVQKYGLNMTTGGFVTTGEYMDVMLGVLWIQVDMETRIQRLLMNTPKVAYDNGGIALIAAQVDATLREATGHQIIRREDGGLGQYTIHIPDISSINPNDIALRELNDISWEAYLAGAIHHATINGVVQY